METQTNVSHPTAECKGSEGAVPERRRLRVIDLRYDALEWVSDRYSERY
jgi:hypothetical protein